MTDGETPAATRVRAADAASPGCRNCGSWRPSKPESPSWNGRSASRRRARERKASIPVRITRVERQCQWVDLEAEIQALAEEYGLHPNEVRREAEALARHRARYGPEPIEATLRRLAEVRTG